VETPRQDAAKEIGVGAPLNLARRHVIGMLFCDEGAATWLLLALVTTLMTLRLAVAQLFQFFALNSEDPFFSYRLWVGLNYGKHEAQPPPEWLGQLGEWIAQHKITTVAAAIPTVIVFAGLVLLVIYLEVRGMFMYQDCVRRAEVKLADSWRRARKCARNFFPLAAAIQLCFSLCAIILMFCFSYFRHSTSTGPGFTITVVAAASIALAAGLATCLLHIFIAPIMAAHNCSVAQAWGELQQLAEGRTREFVWFLLVNLAITTVWAGVFFTASFVATRSCCCCIALLLIVPVAGSLPWQPYLILVWAYRHHFLAQFSEEYEIAVARAGSYDYQYMATDDTRIVACPHCHTEQQVLRERSGTYACATCDKYFEVE